MEENILFRNILHIDNDINSHEFFFDALREVSQTSRYHAFTNASDALNTLVSKKISPDVIFLDLNMPDMTGQEFLVKFKQLEEFSQVPVIIFSASRKNPELLKILGAKAFINKRWSYQLFIQILSAILSFDFMMNSDLASSSVKISKRYSEFAGLLPEEIFSKGISDRGIHLN